MFYPFFLSFPASFLQHPTPSPQLHARLSLLFRRCRSSHFAQLPTTTTTADSPYLRRHRQSLYPLFFFISEFTHFQSAFSVCISLSRLTCHRRPIRYRWCTRSPCDFPVRSFIRPPISLDLCASHSPHTHDDDPSLRGTYTHTHIHTSPHTFSHTHTLSSSIIGSYRGFSFHPLPARKSPKPAFRLNRLVQPTSKHGYKGTNILARSLNFLDHPAKRKKIQQSRRLSSISRDGGRHRSFLGHGA